MQYNTSNALNQVMKPYLSILFLFFFIQFLQAQNDTATVNRLNRLSKIHVRTDSGLFYAQKAIEIAENIDYKMGLGNAYNQLGDTYHYLSKKKLAIDSYLKASEIYESIQPRDSLTSAAIMISFFDAAYTARLQGVDWKVVFEFYRKSLKIAQEIDNKKWIANNWVHFGASLNSKGNYTQAMDYYLKALQMRKNINDERGIGECTTMIGELYRTQEQYKQALENYRNAIPIFEKINNLSGVSTAYLNIGHTYLEEKNYVDALKNYQKAYEIAEKDSIFPLYRNSLKAIADWHKTQNDHTKALEYYQKALQVERKKAVSKGFVIRTWANIGEVYEQVKDYGKAANYYQQSLDSALRMEFMADVLKNYLRFANLYQANAQFEKANFFLIKYNTLKDSLDKANNKERIYILSTLYELDKKQEEIKDWEQKSELQAAETKSRNYIICFVFLGFVISGIFAFFLRKTNTKLKQTNIQLKEANENTQRLNRILKIKTEDIEEKNEELAVLNQQKNKIFSVVAHDLRNFLYGLRPYVAKVTESFGMIEQGKKNMQAEQLNDAVTNIINFLETLLEWATSQLDHKNNQIQTFNLYERVEKSIYFYQKTCLAKNINVTNEIEPKNSIRSNPDLVQMLVRNLLSNALKYTPENGLISIKMQEKKQHWEIIITDTGIGISAERLDTLFEQRVNPHNQTFTDDIESKGLGLWLCRDSVNQLGGKIWAESKIGEGSVFYFTIPKP